MSMQAQIMTLSALRSAYEQKQISPRELILQKRKQAEEENSNCAWIYLLDEKDLEPYLQKLEASDIQDLPLYGVPFAIKDNIDLAGIPTTAACEAFAYMPEKSAFVVQLLIAAGAVPLGKTNLDQFATGLVGTRSPFGEVHNVFNPEYISGGSSAGSAVSTALGQVSFALGTDTAGSGRVPAVLNNLIGHKPTRGLLSNTGLVPACKTLDCISLFALTAADATQLLEIVAQYDSEDAYSRTNHHTNRQRYFSEQSPESFRFAVPEQLDFQDNPETAALFQHAVDQLKQLGGEAISIDISPFLETARLLYEGPWVSERWLATEQVAREAMLPVIRDIVSGAEGQTAADAFKAQYRLAELKRQCDGLMSQVDFLLTPTMPTQYTREQLRAEPIRLNSVNGTYTNFVNLLDYSATAVPIGFTRSGVPWGVSLVADAFQDVHLLGFAAALQGIVNLPLGASPEQLPQNDRIHGLKAPGATIDVVVCGAHLQGQPLNWQLSERGASLQELTKSTANYRLYALADGKRPGMVRVAEGGVAIEVECWSMPQENFGSFVAGIPAPLGIGQVELADGRWACGFICDHYGLEGAQDISHLGSWRAYLASLV